MKQIMLTQGYLALVDDEDYKLVSKYKWHVRIWKGTIYATTNIYISKNKWTTMRMHRLIMSAPKGKDVDHKNGDGLDNQKNNLRICTRAENTRNARKHSQNKSGYKGVWKIPGDINPWVAAITYNYQYIHIGVFATAKEAALAYNQKAKELFGEYASLNSIM